MASYCGTTDCILLFNEWPNVAGTLADAIIAEASAMTDASLGGFAQAPPLPLTAGGTVYDHYIRHATANYAIWLACDGIHRHQYEASGEPIWWDIYLARAREIFDGLQAGRYVMGSSTAIWERGIGPAVPRTNGTIAAAPPLVLVSNHENPSAYYTDDTISRTYLIELEGTGSSIHDGQTYRWQYLGGTAWEQTGQTPRVDEWVPLSYGVAIRWDQRVSGTLGSAMQWTIDCNPSRGRNYPGRGLKVWFTSRG